MLAEEVGAVHADHLGLLVCALRGVGRHGAAVHVVVIVEAVRCRTENVNFLKNSRRKSNLKGGPTGFHTKTEVSLGY